MTRGAETALLGEDGGVPLTVWTIDRENRTALSERVVDWVERRLRR